MKCVDFGGQGPDTFQKKCCTEALGKLSSRLYDTFPDDSDHFFDGIRIAVKESNGELCDKVITYWFELDKYKNTQKEVCFMDGNGRIAKWPKGMFDQFEINAFKLM